MGDAISIKEANNFIVSSFSSYIEIDSQTDTTYELTEDYVTAYGETITAYNSGSILVIVFN